jgi:radical SAM superfamily enzyme YgiQ (UPF0313 family)|tara:strand:+ start:273 stop:1748 length:1476 start_codon:yes stop_codon:yes gene_type:complete
MQKVTFVEPRSPDQHVFSGRNLPLLGPIYLATILKEKGYNTQILNDNFTQVYNEETGELAPEILDADVLALTALTSTAPRGYEIADAFKEQTGRKVVMGGFHATFNAQEALQHADTVAIGPSDSVVERVINGNERIVQGDAACNMDTLPMPDFGLIKDFKIKQTTPITTSRGCPYNCSFCAVTKMFGQRYLFRSEDKVMEEIRRVKSRNIFFYDDHFAANKERTKSLMRKMIDEGIDKRWFAQVRADATNDPELMGLMADSGCARVYVGYESVNPETLKALNKQQTVETIENSIKVFHDNGIMVHGMFIFGSDADDKKSLQMTADFSIDKEIDTVQYVTLLPLPGTPVYAQMSEQNRILTRNWKYYDGQHVVFQPKNMTPIELQDMVIDSMDNFYSKFTGYSRLLKDSVSYGYENALKWMHKKRKAWPKIINNIYKIKGSGTVKKWRKYNKEYVTALAQNKLQEYIDQKERARQAWRARFPKKEKANFEKV